MKSGLAGTNPKIWAVFLCEHPPPPASLFLAARQDGLSYIIREVDAWELWCSVLCFIARLDSPSNIWEVEYETSEKCDTIFIVTSILA